MGAPQPADDTALRAGYRIASSQHPPRPSTGTHRPPPPPAAPAADAADRAATAVMGGGGASLQFMITNAMKAGAYTRSLQSSTGGPSGHIAHVRAHLEHLRDTFTG